jgi:hypothetical protein
VVRRRRSVSLDFFPCFSVGFRGWVLVVFSFCFLFVFSTLFRVLDLDLLQSWERERQVFGSSLLPRSLSLSRDHAVFSSVCRAQVTGVAGGFFCDILQAWASSVVDLPGPHSRELAACWFCVYFLRLSRTSLLKNYAQVSQCTIPASSQALRRDFTFDEVVKTLQPFFFFSFTSLWDQIL